MIVMLAGLGSSVIEDRLSSDALKDEGREVEIDQLWQCGEDGRRQVRQVASVGRRRCSCGEPCPRLGESNLLDQHAEHPNCT